MGFLSTTATPLLLDLLLCGQPNPCEMPFFPQGHGCPQPHPQPPQQGTPKPMVKGDIQVVKGCALPPRALVPACPRQALTPAFL